MNRATFRTLTAAVGLITDADRAEFFEVSVRAVQRWGAFPKHSKNEPPDVTSEIPTALEKRLIDLADEFSREARTAMHEASSMPRGNIVRVALSARASRYPESVREAMERYVLMRLIGEGYQAEASF